MYIIGITGGSGSGKTTFTEKVLAQVNSNEVGVLHQDSYYLPHHPANLRIGHEQNFDHPDAFDWELFRKDLALLREGKRIDSPVYDYSNSCRTAKTTSIGPCKILIVEGIFTLWDEPIRNMMDLKFYLHVEADIRFIRRLFRDLKDRSRTLEDIIRQYYEAVRPMHQLYLEPTKQFADIIVGEETDPAAYLLSGMIKQKLYEANREAKP